MSSSKVLSEKISIIVPVYNVNEYLDRCLYSIVTQTYKNLEIVIIDDGSTDGSGEKCDEWAQNDTRIIVFHTPNGGLSNARNIGLSLASGNYIGFVDSDDWIAPNMYQEMLDAIVNTNADMAICKFLPVTIESQSVEGYPEKACSNHQYVYSREDVFTELLNNTLTNHVWCKLYKKNLFNEIRFPVGKYYEDSYVFYQLVWASNRIATLPKCFYFYFQRKNSISSAKFDLKQLDLYYGYSQMLAFCTENCPQFCKAVKHKLVDTYLLKFRAAIRDGYNMTWFREHLKDVTSISRGYISSNVRPLKLRIYFYVVILYFRGLIPRQLVVRI